MEFKSPDTNDWHLAITAEFKLKTKPVFIECERCGGSGETGGGFKDLDGPVMCNHCWGSKGRLDYSKISPRPAIPDGCYEHMNKAYKDFFT